MTTTHDEDSPPAEDPMIDAVRKLTEAQKAAAQVLADALKMQLNDQERRDALITRYSMPPPTYPAWDDPLAPSIQARWDQLRARPQVFYAGGGTLTGGSPEVLPPQPIGVRRRLLPRSYWPPTAVVPPIIFVAPLDPPGPWDGAILRAELYHPTALSNINAIVTLRASGGVLSAVAGHMANPLIDRLGYHVIPWMDVLAILDHYGELGGDHRTVPQAKWTHRVPMTPDPPDVWFQQGAPHIGVRLNAIGVDVMIVPPALRPTPDLADVDRGWLVQQAIRWADERFLAPTSGFGPSRFGTRDAWQIVAHGTEAIFWPGPSIPAYVQGDPTHGIPPDPPADLS